MTFGAVMFSFLATGAVVVFAGTLLARSGDVLAARTRLGGLWVGSVFLAVATSLPELTTDIAAVRMGEPDLAAGDLFGSSMANMLILALVTLLPAGRALFERATLDHALYATLAIILTAIAAVTLLMGSTMAVGSVSPGSLLIVALYLVGIRAIFRHTVIARMAGTIVEMHAPAAPEPSAGATDSTPTRVEEGAGSERQPTLRATVMRFVAATLLILLAAPRFADAANELAVITGLGTTFVGTWLVGVATSLPELATSIAAVRLGAYDLAVGNLFGSNAFNMSLFLVLDIAHGGPLLSAVVPAHGVSALVAIVLMAAGLSALVYRAKRPFALLEPSAAAMLLIYLAGVVLVFAATRG